MPDDRRSVRSAGGWIATTFHSFVFAAYPVLLVMGANAGLVPLDGGVLARSIAVTTALTVLLLFALKPLVTDLASRAALVTFVLIAFMLYPVTGGTSLHPGLAAGYALASIAVAVSVVKPWKKRPRRSGPLNMAAGLVLGVNLYVFVPAMADGQPWRPAADGLIEAVVANANPVAAEGRRDIYYVILDAFGRPDVLEEHYGLDLDEFVKALEARGFAVPARSQSNYAQTFLSVASSLNLSYLDPLANVMRESGDRRALHYLIQNNALMKLARGAGYRVVAVGSDYSATERMDAADRCHCERFGLHEVEAAAINMTPFRALPLHRWTYGGHRRKVVESFRHLRKEDGEGGPKLVFAHVLAPHPPFVFGPGGAPVANPTRIFSLADGSENFGSPAEYAEGYRHQATYVAGQVLAAVDAILARPGPRPVIVVHGDHGPRSSSDPQDVRGKKWRERLAIFSAYYFPPGGSPPPIPDDISPLNGLRLVANQYLGTALPQLPDTSFVSTWERPYQFEVAAVSPATPVVQAAPPPPASAH